MVGTGFVEIELTPTPRTHFTVELDAPPLVEVEAISILDENGRREAFARSSRWSSDAPARIDAVPRREPVTVGGDEPLERAIAYVPNLRTLFCGSGQPLRPLTLTGQEFKIILIPVPGLEKVSEREAQMARGFQCTHLALVGTESGVLDPAGVDSVLDQLGYYLSFCFGRWVSPFLAVGYSAGNRVTWERWGSGRCDGWTHSQPWVDAHHAEAIERAFPGFNRLQHDPTWARPLREAIHWYVESMKQSGGLEGSIIMSQAALELLSWVYLVQASRYLTADAFKRLKASDRLRLFLGLQGIPTVIPQQLGQLTAAAGGFNWDGSPEALAGMRNSIVHPDDKLRGREQLREATFEIWRLGVWLVELAILALSDFDEEYSNRLTADWVGQVERVPWAG
jgi:hypothetical protein